MNGAPYQYCDKCKTERNFAWIDGFTLECSECGHQERPSVKETVKFSSMKVEGNNNHLSMAQSEKLFDKLIHKIVKKVEEKLEKPIDVSRGVVGELPLQGHEIPHTPIDVRVSLFTTSINLRIFMMRGEDDDSRIY